MERRLPFARMDDRTVEVTLDVLRSEAEQAQAELNALGGKPGFPVRAR